MALELRQQQKLSQQLVITLRLQQAIKLLQLNHQELVTAVQKELIENPTLEELPGTTDNVRSDAERRYEQGVDVQKADELERNNGSESSGGVDWNKVLDEYAQGNSAFRSSAGPSRYEDMPPIEATLTASESLAEHLMWQLGMQQCTDAELQAAISIIHNLDHRGYLESTFEQIALEAEVDMDAVEGALEIVRGLDPIGCGARDLKEVLVTQARHHWPEDPFIVRLLSEHLPDLEARNYQGIAKGLDLDVEDVVEYHRMIQTLEPWPGRPFADAPNQYITPDIEVVKMGGEWQILQNEDGLPRLRISSYYRRVMRDGGSSREEKQYIKERLESADFLIKSIYKRQRTIHRVMKAILERQQDFFEKGAEYLRPMVLRDVADDIEVHESTVSRVTTNKYVQCPHGIFELKYFFNAGIQRMQGEDLAAESVRQKIKKLVAEEAPKTPLSDQQIVKLLKDQNIVIARRTVAKYREAMGILPSNHRKQLF